jgi:hypothetical protein
MQSYRIRCIEPLDFQIVFNYCREWFLFFSTEATEKWSILYHATKTHRAAYGHTPARHRDLLGQAGRRSVGTQYQNDLRGYRGRQAPSQENGQAVSHYTGSSARVLREFAVRKEAEVNSRYASCIPVYRHKNSVSPQVWQPQETDAAMDKPWHKYTSLRPRQQYRWTVRPSETPGLPSWAGGSGSGSVPSPLHIAPCRRTRRGDRLGPSPQPPIRANCLNLNQKKCKFLYDGQSALRADSWSMNPCLRDRPVGRLMHTCRV